MTALDQASIAVQTLAIRCNVEVLRTIMREAWTHGGVNFPVHDAVTQILNLIVEECITIDSKLGDPK